MLRLRNVTFMAADPERLADFWAAALGLTERSSTGDEVLLADGNWTFPRYTFQRVGESAPASNRVHVDLTADDRPAEVARLVDLGAHEVATRGDDELRWTVLRDPEGNEFCVTDAC